MPASLKTRCWRSPGPHNWIPGNVEFITMGEMLRQQIVGGYMEQGNRLAAAGDPGGAVERFRAALAIDPQNAYVAQRLHDVTPPDPDPEHKHVLELLASVDQIDLQPVAGQEELSHAGRYAAAL